MKKQRIQFILGALIILSPFYGFSQRVMTVILIMLGAAVVFFSFPRRNSTPPSEIAKTLPVGE